MTVVQEQERMQGMAHGEEPVREDLVLGNPTMRDVTARIASIVESKITMKYLATLSVTGAMAAWGLFALYYTITTGIGVWGLNNPIGWGWDITNFVFWIGIGHAGTLISAILFLFRQKWRTAINRSAEAMTIFAVVCALTMAAGTAAGGWKIIKTMGHKMVKLQPVHGFAAETTAARADALDGDVREILAGDILDLAVSIAEMDEFGEGARLAGRGEPVETIALAAHDQPFQSEHGIFGRTGGRLGFGQAHREWTTRIYQSAKSLRQDDIRITSLI
jgi:hypothetical protein